MLTLSLKTLRPRLAPAMPSGWKPDAVRGNRHARGYGYAWEKLREQAMRRDKGRCRPCKAKGFVTAAHQVDHIVPKSQGGRDELSNLQAICRACHLEKTARESRGLAS